MVKSHSFYQSEADSSNGMLTTSCKDCLAYMRPGMEKMLARYFKTPLLFTVQFVYARIKK